MEFTNNAIFAGAVLFLISILASGVASRAGAPLLLVFLGVGMLAGREGVGGIAFESFESMGAKTSRPVQKQAFQGHLVCSKN